MKKTREQIGKETKQALKENNYIGTIVISTGGGKSKIAIDAIKDLKVKKVLITSPRTNLKENWQKELDKWGQGWLFGDTHEITIENIQTTYKWDKEKLSSFELVIFDEIHTAVTTEYGRLLQKVSDLGTKRIGLTATPDISRREDKEEFYAEYCPIIYKYLESEQDGVTNKKAIYVVRYNLTDKYQYKVETKKKSWYQGEAKFYDYLQNTIEEITAIVKQDYPFRDVLGLKAVYALKSKSTPTELKKLLGKYWWAISQRKKLLWNLESSKQIAMQLKHRILYERKSRTWAHNKVLVFSELTSKCDKLSRYTIHSAKDKEHNQKMIDLFNEGKIKELASCQSLTLGMNLVGANYAIFESFNSSETNNLQKQGRLNRLPVTDEATLIYVVPRNTQAEKWFEQATENQEVREFSVDNLNL